MTDSGIKIPWRRTPLIRSSELSRAAGCNIYLKLENLQPSGSFKSRAMGNFLRAQLLRRAASGSHDAGDILQQNIHYYISSGGNAGLGCVHAAVTLGYPATVVVPLSTSEHMIMKLRAAGATRVIQQGLSWAEADQHLKEVVLPAARSEGQDAIYVPPFDAQDVWDGNATMVPEIYDQLERVDTHYPRVGEAPGLDAIICSVGGGGLFAGVRQGLEDIEKSDTIVVAVETQGADSLSQAVAKGSLVTLPSITSIATSLGARTVCRRAFEYGIKSTTKTVVLSDAEAVEGCRKFAESERTLVEPACGVCVAMCYDGRLKAVLPDLSEESRVVIVICGGSNISLDMLQRYIEKFAAP